MPFHMPTAFHLARLAAAAPLVVAAVIVGMYVYTTWKNINQHQETREQPVMTEGKEVMSWVKDATEKEKEERHRRANKDRGLSEEYELRRRKALTYSNKELKPLITKDTQVLKPTEPVNMPVQQNISFFTAPLSTSTSSMNMVPPVPINTNKKEQELEQRRVQLDRDFQALLQRERDLAEKELALQELQDHLAAEAASFYEQATSTSSVTSNAMVVDVVDSEETRHSNDAYSYNSMSSATRETAQDEEAGVAIKEEEVHDRSQEEHAHAETVLDVTPISPNWSDADAEAQSGHETETLNDSGTDSWSELNDVESDA